MATGSLLLPIQACTPADNSTNNSTPKLTLQKGSNMAPNRMMLVCAFPPSVASYIWWSFYVPTNYASGGTVRLMWAANATANAVVWGASIGTQASSASDSYLAHNQATAVTVTASVLGTTARRPQETQISLAGNLDGMAADSIAYLVVYRLGTSGSDTLTTVDAELLTAALDYVTT